MFEYTLYNKDVKTNNLRCWKVCAVFLPRKLTPTQLEKIKNIIINLDWDLSDIEKVTNIYKTPAYESDDPNCIGLYWYENGIDTFAETSKTKEAKISKSCGNLILEGKNIGKKNETTPFKQTLFNMASDYKKKLDKGYTTTKVPEKKEGPCMFHPMAIHKFAEKSDKIDLDNSYIQPKLDGVRVLCCLSGENDILIYSRNMKPYVGFTALKNALMPIFKKHPNIYLDGELYIPGITFETLVGIAKNENEKTIDELHLYLFDCFMINKASVNGDCNVIEQTFEERFKILQSLPKTQAVHIVDTIKLEGDIYNHLENYIKNYEGIVVRDKSGIYETSLNKEIRTYKVLKLKKFHDAEYKIIGFTHGKKGKEMNAIKYILETDDGKEFNAVPNQSIKDRQALYKLYTEKPAEFEKIKNKKATIKYQDLTENNIPRFCKFIAVRDYE